VLVPTLSPGDVVIMDNLGSHKGKAVRQAIRKAGAHLLDDPTPKLHRALGRQVHTTLPALTLRHVGFDEQAIGMKAIGAVRSLTLRMSSGKLGYPLWFKPAANHAIAIPPKEWKREHLANLEQTGYSWVLPRL
jgi:hypothetical protein